MTLDLFQELRTAAHGLSTARTFINNGIEMGFIKMPDPESNDPALNVFIHIDCAMNSLALIQQELQHANAVHVDDNYITHEDLASMIRTAVQGTADDLPHAGPHLVINSIFTRLQEELQNRATADFLGLDNHDNRN